MLSRIKSDIGEYSVVDFLDVKLLLENGKIETDLNCKLTDKHQYLLHSSSNPYHMKKNQSPTALLSVCDVFVQKMTSSIPDQLN